MTRTICSLVLGLGVLGGSLVSSAHADVYPVSAYAGVQTACGPNDRDGHSGRNGHVGGSYGTGYNSGYGNSYGYGDRYDHSRYGSNSGYGRASNRDTGRYANGNNDWSNSYRPNAGRYTDNFRYTDNYRGTNSRRNDSRLNEGIRYDRLSQDYGTHYRY